MKSVNPVILLLPLILISCAPAKPVAPPRVGNLENYVVEFTAAPGDTTLTVHSSPKTCANGKKGCIDFAKGKLGTITFRFKGVQKNRDCNTIPRAHWVITKVELSDTADTDMYKGVFGGHQQPWLVDAFPGVDETNGLLYESTNQLASRSVTFIDLNNHEGEKTIYYQVTASNCDVVDIKTINIDPSVTNYGK